MMSTTQYNENIRHKHTSACARAHSNRLECISATDLGSVEGFGGSIFLNVGSRGTLSQDGSHLMVGGECGLQSTQCVYTLSGFWRLYSSSTRAIIYGCASF